MSKPKSMKTKAQLKRSQKKKKSRDAVKRKKALRNKANATQEKKLKAETFRMENEVRKIKNKGLTIRNDKV